MWNELAVLFAPQLVVAAVKSEFGGSGGFFRAR